MICERKGIIYELSWLRYLVSNYLDSEALHFILQEEGRYIRLMKQLSEFSKKFIEIKCNREFMSEEEVLNVYTKNINIKNAGDIYTPSLFFDSYFYIDDTVSENPFSRSYQQKKENTRSIIELYSLMVYTVLNKEDEDEFDTLHPKNICDMQFMFCTE